MQELTKKLRISTERPYAIKKAKDEPMGYEEAMKYLLRGRPKYAIVLRGFRSRDCLSQRQLGEMIGVAQANISMMERGKRPIGKSIAQRLAKVFHTNYKIFL